MSLDLKWWHRVPGPEEQERIDTVRRAATDLRNKAIYAANMSPARWESSKIYDESYTVWPVGVMDSDYTQPLVDRTESDLCRVHRQEANYMAAVDPAFGGAVADWLEAYAEAAERGNIKLTAQSQAVVVAKTFLRERP